MHCCTTVFSQVVLITSSSPFIPSQTATNTSSTPRFFSSANTSRSEPGTLSTIAGADPCGCHVPRSR